MGYVEKSWDVPRWLCFARCMTLSRMVLSYIVPSLVGCLLPEGSKTRGCCVYRFANNEARLVPILHNGEFPNGNGMSARNTIGSGCEGHNGF